METTRTQRGFAIAHFDDANGLRCTVQDSSVASAAMMWFGPAGLDAKTGASRMHLTENMAKVIVSAMTTFLQGGTMANHTGFGDAGDCDCSFGMSDAGGFELRIHDDERGTPSWTMSFDRATVEDVLPALRAFVSSGSIAGEIDEDAFVDTPKPAMDVKIPPSMLARTDVGETGVSAQELIDLVCNLLDGRSDREMADQVGLDRADHVIAVRHAIRGLWRDDRGELVTG